MTAPRECLSQQRAKHRQHPLRGAVKLLSYFAKGAAYRMDAPRELWMTLHELAQLVSTRCGTRTKTANLMQELQDCPPVVRDCLLRDASLLIVALEEMLHLAEVGECSRRHTTSD